MAADLFLTIEFKFDKLRSPVVGHKVLRVFKSWHIGVVQCQINVIHYLKIKKLLFFSLKYFQFIILFVGEVFRLFM